MHTTLSAKNADALVHARKCNGAEASLPWKLLRTYLESCASIWQAVVCRPLFLLPLLSRQNPSLDAVRSSIPSKSTLAHDTVAAAVSHKHHSIIRVGAGLIQFVHGSYPRENSAIFARVYKSMTVTCLRPKFTHTQLTRLKIKPIWPSGPARGCYSLGRRFESVCRPSHV